MLGRPTKFEKEPAKRIGRNRAKEIARELGEASAGPSPHLGDCER
jgi:hypothetical protein